MPIAAQVVALLVAGLVVAQLVNLAVVLLLPPPRPALYHLSDVAAALQGRSLQPRFGRPLLREQASEPPHEGRGILRSRQDLAQLLDVPPEQVRLGMNEPPLWMAPFRGFTPMGREPRGPPDGRFGPDRAGPDPFGPPREPPPPNERMFRFDPGQRPIFGDFVAALQQPSGAWLVVRPQPEPFPNGWQWRIILWFFACVVVFALAGYLFARRMTAPISAFAAAAERLGRDPRGLPMTLSGPAELGAAARAFNEMQVRIKRYVEDRTAMVGAISHDLRTPLTRIRFKVEGAEPGLRASVLTDVAQMEAMISAVLLFIRDANAPAKRERLDLLSLLECEVDGAALSGADVAILDAAPVTIVADPIGLQRLVGNLIDNAVKYGGSARVGLHVEGGEAVIEIADEGPGLPPGEMERVFEPFYRVDPSRNRDSGGIGLGLSVARSIARAHGGDLALVAREAGLMAVVRLPLPVG
ncbi:MAG TPA: HAMP domain-containing sensor histidine kinase [Caulobacteraceae bacterium]|jgi:signal transduction histidine kinase